MNKINNDLPKRKKILCVDFDGVLHSYTSGWHGATNIPDPPITGAIDWLKSLIYPFSQFQVAIFSSRSRYLFGRRAMKKWLRKNGMTSFEIDQIDFPLMKPAAFLLIDDRAIQFQGTFPHEFEMLAFRPYRQPVEKRKKHKELF